MAIQINGNGTITGISSGGLPAGSVTSATLADGAASGTKLTMPAGSIVQVVHASFSTETTIASTSHTDTGLTATISPASASNKILVIVSLNCQFSRSNTSAGGGMRVRRVTGGVDTNIYEASNSPATLGIQLNAFGQGLFSRMNACVNIEDSPNTTSSCVYRVQAASGTTSDNGKVIVHEEDTPSHMTLMEIAA
jgi:hypothetical protein